MAVLSSDFRGVKAKGLTWNLFNTFQSLLASRQASLATPGLILKDRVFFRFSWQPSVSILKLAIKVFCVEVQGDGQDVRRCKFENWL